MNSTSIKVKKFLSNRNTVTIICAVIGVIVLFVGYQMRINSAIQPIRVPYAKVTIQPRTKITDDMIGYIEIPQAAIDDMGQGNIIVNEKEIIDYYTNINTMIPQGSMFYKGVVVPQSDLPDHAVYNVPKGETLYYLTVNMTTSYVNSIVPNGYIDIYIRTTDETTGQVRVGKFIENIKVLDVRDSDGLNVFENTDEVRVPAYVMFSVSNKTLYYLMAAQELGLDVIPVPVVVEDVDLESSNVTSSEIESYIDALASEYIQDGGSIDTEQTDIPGQDKDEVDNSGDNKTDKEDKNNQ